MPKIRKKVWKKLTPESSAIFADIEDNDTIGMIVPSVEVETEEIDIIKYGSDVVSSSLFELVKDLIYNDTVLSAAKDSSSEIISEGVFDITRSSLTTDEEAECADLIIKRDRGWTDEVGTPYTETIKNIYIARLELLLRRKYWCNFLIDSATTSDPDFPILIEVGPGKLKTYEEDLESDTIYFVSNENESDGVFEVAKIGATGYYRRDLVQVTFRDTGNTVPRLDYVYGEETDLIPPHHTLKDKQLESDFGSYPLWSILYKNTATVTELIRIDRVFEWSGLQAIVLYEIARPFKRLDGSWAIHSHEDKHLKNLNGELLTSDYGESASAADNIDGPEKTFLQFADLIYNTVPTDLDTLNDDEASAFYFPFRISELYNNYVSYSTVELRQIELAFDLAYRNAVSGEGVEAHIFTARRFATLQNDSEINVVSHAFALANTRSVLTIDASLDTFVKTTLNGTDWYTNALPQVGDIVVITSGKGEGQIASILAYTTGASPTVTVKALASPPIAGSKITIFDASTEEQIGVEITETWLDSLDITSHDDYHAQYPYSQYTGESILPFMDAWPGALKTQLDAAFANTDLQLFPLEATPAGIVVFPFKIRLTINQWYFIKTCVQRKIGAQPHYEATAPIALANTTDNLLVSRYPYFTSTYLRNVGLYPGVSEEGIVFFKIFDQIETSPGVFIWADIEDDTYSVQRQATEIALGSGIYLPPYWKPMAKNLDSANIEFPPSRALPGDPGIVYVDVLSGKVTFAEDEEPTLGDGYTPMIGITYVANNTITGKLNTESIIHIFDPEGEHRVMSLAAYMQDLDARMLNAVAEAAAALGPALDPVAQLAIQKGNGIFAEDTGTANNVVIALDPILLDYYYGMKIHVLIAHNNTTASTLTVNSLAAVPIKKNVSSALEARDLRAGEIVTFYYDDTNFQIAENTRVYAVGLTGNQSIDGAKTFTSFPLTPSSAPTTDYQVGNKKYTDNTVNYKIGIYIYAADAGTVNAIVITPSPVFAGYTDGMCFNVKVANTSTSTIVNINVNNLGNIRLKRPSIAGLVDPPVGSIYAGNTIQLVYNTTAGVFEIIGGLPAIWE